jgi:ubiquinone/menaquinone biosynthesis C-methylase UbiE
VSFYRGRYAELYDLFYADKPYAAEARFVFDRMAAFGNGPPRRILELACGTGAHALALAELGASVEASDCSQSMVEVAREKLVNAGPASVSFSVCDMQALPTPEQPFDAAVCLFDSIGYVQTDEALAQVFDGVRRSLKPGGLFVFEYWHAPTMSRRFDPLRVRRLQRDETTVLRLSETSLVPGRPIARVKYDIYELRPGGDYDHLTETQSNRFFSVDEMDRFARAHGFTPAASYGGFDLDAPITDETWHVVAVWQAPARAEGGLQ